MTPNRGARVRPIDEEFIRDIYEIEMLIEPALTKWFVGMATDRDIAELGAACSEIEANSPADPVRQAGGLTRSSTCWMYGRYYDRYAADLWWKHREIVWRYQPTVSGDDRPP